MFWELNLTKRMRNCTGRIPDEGENPVVECLGYEFQILKVGNKMIQSVRVVRKETEEEREPEET